MVMKNVEQLRAASKAGRPRRSDVNRTATGQISRAAEGTAPYTVYIARQAGSSRIKIGRTRNPKARMQAYETAAGVPVHFVASALVRSYEASKIAEALAIKALKARYTAFRREWFECTPAEAYAVLIRVVATMQPELISITGAPTLEENTRDGFRYEVNARSNAIKANYRR